MTLPPLLAPRLTRASRLPFHWRGDRFSLTALSGQAATFSRAATATPADFNGTNRTIVHSAPAWQHEDWDGDSTRDMPTLLMGGSNKVYWSFPMTPQAMTLYVEFVERGAVGVASAAVAYIGNAGNTGARLWIDSTNTYYRVRHHNGTSEVSATLAAAPSAGNRVALRATLASDGKVQLHQSINGAAESSTSASSALTLPTAWADTRLYLGTTGDTNAGVNAFVRVRVAQGNLSAAVMQGDW